LFALVANAGRVCLPINTTCRGAAGKGDTLRFRTLMQAGPAKANELFAKLSETSDGAVKTREKLFADLKAELELHTTLEEQHLFPVLRRNAETKGLVADAIKDNRELRAKLAELEALPKNDEGFPERLKELQKTFRQHARDEKRELLPAVQRALSEEQVQGVAEKIEAGVAEAEQARQDELEERRLKVRQEREEAERLAEVERARNIAAEQARQEEVEQKRAKLRHEREVAERQAEQEAAAKRAQRETAETVARAATAAQTSVLCVAQAGVNSMQRTGAEIQGMTNSYIDAVKTLVPDLQTVAALPKAAVSAMTDIRSAWIDLMGQTTQMSQDLLRQGAEQQQRFAADAVRSWVEHNARVMQITMRVAQEGFQPFANRAVGSDAQKGGR
jgi:iron-sulfur cluster repair protein YtfE (RIC family)